MNFPYGLLEEMNKVLEREARQARREQAKARAKRGR